MSDWSVVCHSDAAQGNEVAIITAAGAGFQVKRLSVAAASGRQSLAERPQFLGVSDDNRALVLYPESREIKVQQALEADSFPIYSYRDPDTDAVWFVSDGDKENGYDSMHGGDSGSSVVVVSHSGDAAAPAQISRIIGCGRGHHVVTFTGPSAAHPDVPRKAFISNLLDGSIHVVGHDQDAAGSYLQVTATINLAEPDREEGGNSAVPNNAFPHGQVYSPVTGELYGLNNGYATIAVIDPASDTIIDRIALKRSSNLLLSPCGRYLIGKGADRKTDPDHVTGTLSVVDAAGREVLSVLEIPDFYPSVYRFSADGSRLYVTSAATGKGQQRDNLQIDTVRVYDATELPALGFLREIKVGRADCGRRPIAFYAPGGVATYTFVPNPSDGTLTIIDGVSDEVLDTVAIGPDNAREVSFSFWRGGDVYGA